MIIFKYWIYKQNLCWFNSVYYFVSAINYHFNLHSICSKFSTSMHIKSLYVPWNGYEENSGRMLIELFPPLSELEISILFCTITKKFMLISCYTISIDYPQHRLCVNHTEMHTNNVWFREERACRLRGDRVEAKTETAYWFGSRAVFFGSLHNLPWPIGCFTQHKTKTRMLLTLSRTWSQRSKTEKNHETPPWDIFFISFVLTI